MNVWIVTGRVTRDAELRTTNSGEKVLTFSIANDVGFGERKTTQFPDCSLWGKRAEALAQYIRKGDKITVSGELRLEEYQKRDGSTGSKLSVRVSEIELGGAKEDGAQRGQAAQDNRRGDGGYRNAGYDRRGGGGSQGAPRPVGDDLDDSIPFATDIEMAIGADRFGKNKPIL